MADGQDGPYEPIQRNTDTTPKRRQLTEFFRNAAIVYTALAAANLILQVILFFSNNGHPLDLIPVLTSNLYGVVIGLFFVCFAELFLRTGDDTDAE